MTNYSGVVVKVCLRGHEGEQTIVRHAVRAMLTERASLNVVAHDVAVDVDARRDTQCGCISREQGLFGERSVSIDNNIALHV